MLKCTWIFSDIWYRLSTITLINEFNHEIFNHKYNFVDQQDQNKYLPSLQLGLLLTTFENESCNKWVHFNCKSISSYLRCGKSKKMVFSQ